MAGMLPMVKNSIADWRNYHGTLAKPDAWIGKHAGQSGYSVNPRGMLRWRIRRTIDS
jgi:hypothetical protein